MDNLGATNLDFSAITVGYYRITTPAAVAPPPDDLLAFAREYDRRTGRRLARLVAVADHLTRRALAGPVTALLAALDCQATEARRLALVRRERVPRPPAPPRRARTCGASSRLSARPPTAV